MVIHQRILFLLGLCNRGPGYIQLRSEQLGLFYDFDCTEVSEVLNWNALHNVAEQFNESAAEPLWGKVNLTWAGWVFGTDEMQERAERECPIGVLMLAILQFYMSAHSGDLELTAYWRDFVQHSIAGIPWYFTALSRWPIFELLHYYQPMMGVDKKNLETACCPQKSGYLDWHELLGLGVTFADGAEKGMVDEVVASALGQATEHLFTLGNERIDEAVEQCLCGVVFLTIVQSTTSGNRLTQYFEKWSAVATDFLNSLPLAMYAATDWPIMQALLHFGDLGKGKRFHEFVTKGMSSVIASCQLLPGLVCWEVPYSQSQIHRYTVAQMLIHMGFDAFYFDLDTFFIQNPLVRMMDYLSAPATHGSPSRLPEDLPQMLWSTHVDGHCINVGIFYMVASTKAGEWSTMYLNWLHLHSYEIDQRGVNALLNYTPTIHVSFEPPSIMDTGEGIPPYSTLDDVNEFISPDGWSGELSSLYIIHFIAIPMTNKIGNLTQLYDAVEGTPDIAHGILTVADHVSAFRMATPPDRMECW
ncbi:hypothetical protein FOL47_010913 [Perkinsus chesapeaki]|uniref:Nucleotide-diphospho-sugar transferase domain-containing protein n=1 Tax=Perkinsus chesapeaki TaxID=330153 RepID=A0A7J6L1I0_PERCH|nr:hypothetical protein FOL47_010913 [Perkinsus chesapeaki]